MRRHACCGSKVTACGKLQISALKYFIFNEESSTRQPKSTLIARLQTSIKSKGICILLVLYVYMFFCTLFLSRCVIWILCLSVTNTEKYLTLVKLFVLSLTAVISVTSVFTSLFLWLNCRGTVPLADIIQNPLMNQLTNPYRAPYGRLFVFCCGLSLFTAQI